MSLEMTASMAAFLGQLESPYEEVEELLLQTATVAEFPTNLLEGLEEFFMIEPSHSPEDGQKIEIQAEAVEQPVYQSHQRSQHQNLIPTAILLKECQEIQPQNQMIFQQATDTLQFVFGYENLSTPLRVLSNFELATYFPNNYTKEFLQQFEQPIPAPYVYQPNEVPLEGIEPTIGFF